MSSALNCNERKKGLMNDSKENQISNSTGPSFSNMSVKSRSLKNVENALPKSPNKRNEIVQCLSQKIYLQIIFNSKKPRHPENDLSEDEVERLCQFMDRTDITYTHPRKKDGKSKFVSIRDLLWAIRDLLEIINGCSGIAQSERDNFPIIFDKKLTFRKQYKFLK